MGGKDLESPRHKIISICGENEIPSVFVMQVGVNSNPFFVTPHLQFRLILLENRLPCFTKLNGKFVL